MIPCDLHVHPDYSIDAHSSIDDYCRKAEQIGLKVIGFSTHYDINPARDDIDPFMNVDGEKTRVGNYALGRYFDDCREARDHFADLKILIGLEVDYFPGVEAEIVKLKSEFSFDYLIGSVHCLDGIAISSNREAANYFNAHSLDRMADQYFDLLYHAANCGLFDTIGHADYYLLHGIYHYGEKILNIHNGRLDKTIEAAVRTSTGFEINTSYLRKGGDHFYPRLDFLKAIIDGGGTVNAIGSDAHRADDLGSGVNEALKFLADHEIQFKPFYESD